MFSKSLLRSSSSSAARAGSKQARSSIGNSSSTANSLPVATRRSSSAAAVGNSSSRSGVVTRAVPIDLGNLTQEQLYAGGAVLISLLGMAVVAATGTGEPVDQDAAAAAAGQQEAEPLSPPLPRVNAVLVFGGTGKLGRKIAENLVRAGRTVVVAARSTDKATEVFGEAGLQEGYQTTTAAAGDTTAAGDEGSSSSSGGSNGDSSSSSGKDSGGILIFEGGVDVTDPDTLKKELFEGVTQVVYALGPVAGRLPEGGFGYIDNMTPERVEKQGMANIITALKSHCPALAAAAATSQLSVGSATTILPMRSAEDMEAWQKLDDVIMGGNSSSGLSASEDGSGAVWSGDLIVEGGGFCGTRTKPLNLDLSAYDGLQMRVKGDGQIFKFNIKTADQEDTPESTYQATFDTSPDGDWTTVRIPWHNFVPVKRAQSDPAGAPLDASTISKFGLVLSRFEFNKMPNPACKPGPFTLQIDGGISAYKAPRPALVAISSAGVERNAIIGDDAAARKRDIPIVQLNPGGVLNYKYDAECELRASGLPYTIIRCTGLDDRSITGPALLEADQGDSISGKVSRSEAADTVAAALASPDAAYKTFELRQSEAADAAGKEMSAGGFTRLFLKLALDRNRSRVGLRPFPRAVPPPPPPTEDRTKEILADPRVQAVKERESKAKQEEGEQQQEQQGEVEGEKQQEQQVEQKEKELVSANA